MTRAALVPLWSDIERSGGGLYQRLACEVRPQPLTARFDARGQNCRPGSPHASVYQPANAVRTTRLLVASDTDGRSSDGSPSAATHNSSGSEVTVTTVSVPVTLTPAPVATTSSSQLHDA